MESKQFTVMIAGIAKPGMEDYIKSYLTKLQQHSRDDAGCIVYNVHQSTTDPKEFMVYMVWQDEAAFERHNQKPEMQEFKKELAPDLFVMQSPKLYWQLL